MFTWNEMVGVYLLEKLGSTDLVVYMMGHVKKGRRDFLEEEAREWHTSLRIKQEDRWRRVSELSMKRKFHKMNSSVPITCTLPFDGGMWRNSQIMLRMIRCFRGSFIRKNPNTIYETIEEFWVPETAPHRASVTDKIRIVKKIYSAFSTPPGPLVGGVGVISAEEALNDHILFLEEPDNTYEYEELPYICERRIGNERIEDSILMIVN